MSTGGLHPEVLVYKGTFSGGNVRPRVLTQDETFYRYHGGEFHRMKTPQLGRFLTKESFTNGTDAANKLALLGTPPTHYTKMVVPAGTLVWEGSAAPLGSRLGGGQQTFIPSGRLSAVSVSEAVSFAQ
jgi:hypothetical protein